MKRLVLIVMLAVAASGCGLWHRFTNWKVHPCSRPAECVTPEPTAQRLHNP